MIKSDEILKIQEETDKLRVQQVQQEFCKNMKNWSIATESDQSPCTLCGSERNPDTCAIYKNNFPPFPSQLEKELLRLQALSISSRGVINEEIKKSLGKIPL